MSAILIPVISVSVIGLICAVMLVTASKLMAVPSDERFEQIRDCLPGANCGSCGYAGCDGYAHALADGEEKHVNLCIPGADAVANQIADTLGVETQDVVEMVAYVACGGDSTCTTRKYNYHGIRSCVAADMLYSGSGTCTNACLGCGDCAAVCPNGAICIEDGLARVIPSLCMGCGLCARVCPNHLIHVVPDTVRTIVRCSNTDKGAVTRKACSDGCIGCKKCVRECPEDAISVQNNLAVIDYRKCIGCGHCAEICTTGSIRNVNLANNTRFSQDAL
ncbi:MAG: RnfABCDGE type electron transport complex subunit B [Christensenellales bacterium]|nr:RnfABCDGE type electron transport complex subunit B [Christensenellales bacterium]